MRMLTSTFPVRIYPKTRFRMSRLIYIIEFPQTKDKRFITLHRHAGQYTYSLLTYDLRSFSHDTCESNVKSIYLHDQPSRYTESVSFIRHFTSLFVHQMSREVSKSTSWHVRPAKIQISLRIHAG